MKTSVLRLLTLIAFTLFNFSFCLSQTRWFRSTEFSYKCKEYGVWTDWSDWEYSNVKIKMDIGRDIITIFSPKKQVYHVLGEVEPPYDPNGTQVKFKVIDQDSDLGYVRLRVEDSGNSQLYVDFGNVKWVYNVVRIQ